MRITELQARVRGVLENETVGNACEPVWDYEALERICDSFQDGVSKKQYEQEIVYLALREAGSGKAAQYSPCSNRQWQSASLLAKILQDGFNFQRLGGWRLPELEVPPGHGSQYLESYFHLTTFIFVSGVLKEGQNRRSKSRPLSI